MSIKIKHKPRMLYMIIILVLFAIIITQFAHALGVSPGLRRYFFEPDKEIQSYVWIVNHENRSLDFEITKEGEIAAYITLLNHSISINESELFKPVFYNINLPEKMENIGSHKGWINIKLTREDSRGNIQVEPVLKSGVEIFVLHPGKHLEKELVIKSEYTNSPILFNFHLENKGSEDFENIFAEVSLEDPVKDTTKKASTIKISLEKTKQADLNAKITGMQRGSYPYHAELHSDGSIDEFNGKLEYGEWLVTLDNFTAKDYVLGDIAEFRINFTNHWNIPAEDVYAEITISDNKGYRQFTSTNTKTIPPYSSREFVAYWDSRGAYVGKYFFTLKLSYANRSKMIYENINVNKNSIITRFSAPADKEKVRFNQMKDQAMVYLKYIAIGILALLAVVVISFLAIQILDKLPLIISRIRPVLARHLTKIADYIPWIEILRKRTRLRSLDKQKERYKASLELARTDLSTLKKAIAGLKKELNNGIISSQGYRKRIALLLDNKPLSYWEEYYSGIMRKYEEKIKRVKDEIWKEG